MFGLVEPIALGQLVFLIYRLIFMSMRIFKFQSVIKKILLKGPLPNYGACQKFL
jgi:hypothetical protein